MFALDYALWFDVLLPGLDRIGMPMPLGGTSNHFRTAVLRDIGGWTVERSNRRWVYPHRTSLGALVRNWSFLLYRSNNLTSKIMA